MTGPTDLPLEFTQADTGSSIPARFEQIARAVPSRAALRFGECEMTYEDLNEASSRLRASLLTQLGTKKEPVAVLCDARSGILTAILGVLSAGKYFSALNPYDPPARKAEILSDLGARLLVTDEKLSSQAQEILPEGVELVNIDRLPANPKFTPVAPGVRARDIAGIFYSSGSTGKPKGIPRDHATILHRAWIDRTDLQIHAGDRFIQLRQFAFSASLADAMNALLNGCSLYMYDLHKQGLEALAQTLSEQRITILRPPLELFRHFLASLPATRQFPDIRCLVMTGDVFFRKDVEHARRHFAPDTQVIHHFSSSETGVLCRNIFRLDTPIDSEVIPVGRAVAGKEVFLLDGQHRPVAAGQSGEIAVRTDFRFQSYWKQPELDAQKIIPDPELPGGRIYLTGDQGRFQQDGQLEFLGRMDNRVKIRGFSVDLNAVEAVMTALEPIQRAVASTAPDADDEKRLIAYYTSQDGKPIAAVELRRQLASDLPDYLLPSQFIHLDRFPLTESGKVDRRNLPPPGTGSSEPPFKQTGKDDQLPAALAQIWQRVLQVKEITPEDDFFSLGGTSLSALRLADEISRAFRQPFSPEDVFHLPTIAEQAAFLAGGGSGDPQKCLKVIKPGGDRPAIFCISPTIIDLYTYRHLAEFLSPDQPFHALYASRGLALDGSLISIDEEIDRFIQEMREVQPRGPYILAGYSGGGKVAIEMAHHLQQAGEQVALVILLDSFAPGYPKLLPWLPPRAYNLFRTLRRIGSYWWKFRILDARGKRDLLLSRENPLGPRFDNWVRNRYRELNRPVKSSHLQEDDPGRSVKFNHLDSYRGKTYLMRAQKGLLGVRPDATLGWGKWIKKDLDVVAIPGDHEAILFGPRAEKVAGLIQAKIDSLKLELN